MKINNKQNLKFKKFISNYCEDVVVADGLQDAFIGLYHASAGTVAVYDKHKVLKIISKELDIGWDEAEDYAEFNIFNAKIGDQTPIFITPIKKSEWNEEPHDK
jgi:hypothetical protein